MNKIEIHKKGGFSERKGIKQFSDVTQTSDINSRTRNKLYTAFKNQFDELCDDSEKWYKDYSGLFIYYLYTEIFSMVEDDIPKTYNGYDYSATLKDIKNIFTAYDYNEVFDLIESLFSAFDYIEIDNKYSPLNHKEKFIRKIERVFKEENVNYRIVNDIITDIVNQVEINSINDALANGETVTQNHISKALEYLYKNKDYDNSIKESISAVESICQIVTGDDKATLGKAINKLPSTVHSALKEAFKALYGYTSDANGIRHANGLGEGNSTFEEAKYMLISCSAFINYLREETK